MFNWTTVGKKHTEGKEDELKRIVSRMEWQEIGEGLILPFIPGEGIKFLIKEFKIPNVSHIAISHELAPYGLYGIYGHYKNANVRLYFVDEGSCITSIMQEVENYKGGETK